MSSDRTRADYAEVIVAGSMPEASQLRSPRLRRAWYQSYLDRILTKDIQDVARVAQPEKIRSLLAELASVQGSEAVIGRLAKDANIPAATARSYMDHLRALHLISVIPPWTQNLLKREVGKPKIVLNDQGLAAYVTNSTAAVLSDMVKGQAMGGFLEAFVGTELLKQCTWSDTEWSLSHYRSPDGREIDLVIECADRSVIGVKVKAAASVQSSDYKHLQWLRDQMPDRFVAGIVLTTEGRGRILDRKIYSLPVDTLWSV